MSAVLLVGAVAARQTPLPDLSDDVFAVGSEVTDHLAKANDHLKEAGKAMTWCDMHLREAAREFSLASALKMKTAKKAFAPPDPLPEDPHQVWIRTFDGLSPQPSAETVAKAK